MELSARVFGLNSWSQLVPQAVQGVAAVGLLFAAVRRWFGPAAGLLAGAMLACTPVAALMFRFDNPDALLVLLMTAAAYAVLRAIESGRTRWLVLAGALLGFGFLTKMLQAFLVLLAFGAAYLITGPGPARRRIGQLLAGAGALVVAAGWWVAAVTLTPAADRPYVGGSTNDSILQLALGYNGLGRLDGNETGSVGFSGHGGGSPSFSGAAGLGRLFAADMGGQVSWLLPAALIAIAVLARLSWRLPRTSRTLAAALLWGGWLLVTGAVFSLMQGIIHPYYRVALAPAIAALAAVGAILLWRSRSRLAARLALAGGTAVTAWWSWELLRRTSQWYPALRLAVLAAGLAAAVLLLAEPWLAERWPATVRPLAGRPAAGGPAAGQRSNGISGGPGARAPSVLAASAAVLALSAALAGPAAYSADTVTTAHTGALPSAGPTVTSAGGPGGTGGPGGPGGPGGAGGPGGTTIPGGLAGRGRSFSGAPTGAGSARSGTAPGGGTRPAAGGTGAATGKGSTAPQGSSRGAGPAGTRTAGSQPGPGGLSGATQVSAALRRLLGSGAGRYRWAAATVGSESAAPLQLATGEPIMAIGGFNGTDPVPTLREFERMVAAGEIHYFVGTNSGSFGGGSGAAAQISRWVASHYRAHTVGGVKVYDLG